MARIRSALCEINDRTRYELMAGRIGNGRSLFISVMAKRMVCNGSVSFLSAISDSMCIIVFQLIIWPVILHDPVSIIHIYNIPACD